MNKATGKLSNIEGDFVFFLDRTLDAPLVKVWDAWTKAEQLQKWFGPKGCPISSHALDFRVGGIYHYCMDLPNGDKMWGKWVFKEIVPQQTLLFISSFSDETGGITRHPMAPGWPLEMISKITFTEENGKTTISMQGGAYNATEAERQAYADGRESMRKGWGGTFEQLEAYLAQ